MKYLLKYATFWGGFSCFHGQKNDFSIFSYIVASALKSCFEKEVIFFLEIGKNFFSVKNRLPLTICLVGNRE